MWKPRRPTDPTPAWFWWLFAAVVVDSVLIDAIFERGRGVEALVLASATFIVMTALLGRLPPSRNRDRGVIVPAICIALSVGRNAVPAATFWSKENAMQFGVTIAVALSLGRLSTLWIDRCDRRRAATAR